MKAAEYKIYSLICPIDGKIKYIGKTKNTLCRRLREHIRVAKKGRPYGPKSEWINLVLSRGLKPIIALVEVCTKDNWRERERYWCGFYGGLFNLKRAGGGSDGERLELLDIQLIMPLLGHISDSSIAERIGATRKAVSYYREQLGIPASFDRSRNKPPPPMGGHNKIKFDESILGTLPDYKIAEKFGVDKSCVARRRRALGIKSYADSTGNNGTIKKGEPHRRWSKHAAFSARPTV